MLKAFAITLGLVASFALGAYMADRATDVTAPAAVVMPVRDTAAPAEPSASELVHPPAPKAVTVPASSELVRQHVKPLMTAGTDTKLAADGFRSGEQFVATAYAAQQTNIPFVLLKHRVLKEGKSLAAAIRESRPELDATLEVNRAMASARADLARLVG